MTSQPADPARRRDLAAIHAAARAQGLDEDTYRGLLERETGLTSAAAMDAAQRARVLRALGGRGGDGDGWRPHPKPPLVSDGQWKYIRDLVGKLHLDEQSFARVVRHITGLERPEWLDAPRAGDLIAGMIRLRDHTPTTSRRIPARGNPRRPR